VTAVSKTASGGTLILAKCNFFGSLGFLVGDGPI
jgi:hypothetical protein